MSEPASYLGPAPGAQEVPSPEQAAAGLGLSVRWHNKLARAGNEQGGYDAEIIEGIERLVFNQDQLDALGLTLESRGVISIPGYGLQVRLEALEPADGPLNVYWVVSGQ